MNAAAVAYSADIFDGEGWAAIAMIPTALATEEFTLGTE